MAELAISIKAKNEAGPALSGLSGQLTGVQKQIDGLKQGLTNAGQGLQNFGAKMSLGVTAPLAGLGAVAISAASDLSESLSKVNVVFGENAAAIEAWSATADESFGMSQQQALEASGTLGNLFGAMGIGASETQEMSTSLVELAADLASFNNMDPTEALDKLRAGMVGETEPLRALGVNLTAASVEAKALAMGLAATGKELTEQDKVTARYALIMEQTATAQGDFARTADGLANSQRILKAQMADASAELGTILLPYMLQAVQAISQLVGWFGSLSPSMQQFVVIAGAAAAAIGPVSAVLGTVLTVVSALISPIGLVVAAVAALGVAWSTNFLGIQDATAAMWAVVQPALQQAYDWTASQIPGALATMQEAWSTVWAAVSAGVDAAMAVIAPQVASLAPYFADLQAAMADFWTAVQPILEQFGFMVTSVMGVLGVLGVNLLQQAFTTFGASAMIVIQQVTLTIQSIVTVLTEVITLVTALINGDWATAFASAKNIVAIFEAYFEQTFNNLLSLVTTIFTGIAAVITDTLTDMGVDVKGILSGITTWWASMWEAMSEKVKPVTDAIDGVRKAIEGFQEWLGSISLTNPFEGWSFPALPDWMGGGQPPNSAIGRMNFGGGLTMVGETGPELVMLPRASRIYGAQETRTMAAQGSGVSITVESMNVRSPLDIQEIAYQVADILVRR